MKCGIINLNLKQFNNQGWIFSISGQASDPIIDYPIIENPICPIIQYYTVSPKRSPLYF